MSDQKNSPTVADFALGYGSVEYVARDDGRPARTRQSSSNTLNVTINDAEILPSPSCFVVNFNMMVPLHSESVEGENPVERNAVLHLRIPLRCEKQDQTDLMTSFQELEDQAAHHLPHLLRSIAGHIEQQIAETDARRAKAPSEDRE